MIESQGIIRIENPESRRRRFIRSAISQSILQCLTFASAIVTYHYFVMPQSANEAYGQGYGQGYGHAHDLYAPKSK